jgi:hypothetical protein
LLLNNKSIAKSLLLGAHKLSGLAACDLSGFTLTQEESHETGRIATGDPENAIYLKKPMAPGRRNA